MPQFEVSIFVNAPGGKATIKVSANNRDEIEQLIIKEVKETDSTMRIPLGPSIMSIKREFYIGYTIQSE